MFNFFRIKSRLTVNLLAFIILPIAVSPLVHDYDPRDYAKFSPFDGLLFIAPVAKLGAVDCFNQTSISRPDDLARCRSDLRTGLWPTGEGQLISDDVKVCQLITGALDCLAGLARSTCSGQNGTELIEFVNMLRLDVVWVRKGGKGWFDYLCSERLLKNALSGVELTNSEEPTFDGIRCFRKIIVDKTSDYDVCNKQVQKALTGDATKICQSVAEGIDCVVKLTDTCKVRSAGSEFSDWINQNKGKPIRLKTESGLEKNTLNCTPVYSDSIKSFNPFTIKFPTTIRPPTEGAIFCYQKVLNNRLQDYVNCRNRLPTGASSIQPTNKYLDEYATCRHISNGYNCSAALAKDACKGSNQTEFVDWASRARLSPVFVRTDNDKQDILICSRNLLLKPFSGVELTVGEPTDEAVKCFRKIIADQPSDCDSLKSAVEVNVPRPSLSVICPAIVRCLDCWTNQTTVCQSKGKSDLVGWFNSNKYMPVLIKRTPDSIREQLNCSETNRRGSAADLLVSKFTLFTLLALKLCLN